MFLLHRLRLRFFRRTGDQLTAHPERAEAIADDLIALRRSLHQYPEIGLRLPVTQSMVLDALDGLPLEVSTGVNCDSVTAVLRGGAAQPGARQTTLLRADMDALPIQEALDIPYASKIDGAMHACGHDLHTTMLVGAARILSSTANELAGDVVFMFQPGEEGFDGAQIMIDEGVLVASGALPTSAWALHALSGRIPNGVISGMAGATMSASNELRVTITGRGGHGAAPHRAKDPVMVAAEMITGLQTLMTRLVSPFEPAVLTVGTVHAGTKVNIIPETAVFAATIRCFNSDVVDLLESELVRYCTSLGMGHRVEVEASFVRQYPATINDSAAVQLAQDATSDLFGSQAWMTPRFPSMGSEDFSRILQQVPGAMLFLGASVDGPDWESSPENHAPVSAFDDSVITTGTALLAELAARSLVSARAES